MLDDTQGFRLIIVPTGGITKDGEPSSWGKRRVQVAGQLAVKNGNLVCDKVLFIGGKRFGKPSEAEVYAREFLETAPSGVTAYVSAEATMTTLDLVKADEDESGSIIELLAGGRNKPIAVVAGKKLLERAVLTLQALGYSDLTTIDSEEPRGYPAWKEWLLLQLTKLDPKFRLIGKLTGLAEHSRLLGRHDK